MSARSARASCCVDDAEVRARDDRVLAAPDGLAATCSCWSRRAARPGWPAPPILGAAPPPELRIDCAALAALLARDEATVIDLSLSRDYRKAHIPGAWFAIRSRLGARARKNPAARHAGADLGGRRARRPRGAGGARADVDVPVRYLDGGNAAWRAAGHPLTADDPRMADEPVDAWLKPYERPNDTAKAMSEYLSWEIDLLARIERDGSAKFRSIRAVRVLRG